jgi:hypothetical protein
MVRTPQYLGRVSRNPRPLLEMSLNLTLCLSVTVFAMCDLSLAQAPIWVAQGPGPNTRGQVENIDNGEVVGAVKAVALHPTNANIAFIGSVNGGIWKTNNATSPKPSWEHLTDDRESLSIGAIEFDPSDSTHLTLIAGAGRFSSLAQYGGSRIGLLRTTNGGTSWDLLDGEGALRGMNISGVAPRGDAIVISVNDTDACDDTGNCDGVGIWRRENRTAKWIQISGGPTSGLPAGASSSLVGDPNDNARFYTNAGGSGIYCSTNTGETWHKISTTEMDGLTTQADNIKIAVGKSNNVYVAIDVPVDEKREVSRLAGVFRSGDGGTTWKKMDLPATKEGGIHPGGQGGIHLSIAADPSNASIVYIGGDAQPGNFPGPANSIGALDYSGRLFRGDASKPGGKQWVHLTHSNKLGVSGGGTSHCSAPHADSRSMAIAANGVLIETDDGGIYRRTNPQTNAGDWFSMNGDIQVTEFHSVAWDGNAHVVVGGAQDTGTPMQETRAAALWDSVSKGDGGVVAVDTSSAPGRSIRYSSFFDFYQFRRRVYDSSNNFINEIKPPLRVLNGGSPLGTDQFYTPIRLNSVAPSRLIIGGSNSVYESFDQGDTIREIGPGVVVNGTGPNPIAYGASDNPDILYVGDGDHVLIRKRADPDVLKPSATYAGGTALGIALDPSQGQTAFVVSPNKVNRTTDAGIGWTEITGNLSTLRPGSLRSITYCTRNPQGSVIVGSDNGVFVADGPGFSNWSRLGTGMPNAPVYHIEYDKIDQIVLAGTLGRGAWVLAWPSASLKQTGNQGGDDPRSRAQPKLRQVSFRIQERAQLDNSPTPSEENAEQGLTTLQLVPGVIIDKVRGRLYAMGADGGIAAIDLASGKRIWATTAAAKPIGFAADKVIGQAETPETSHNLEIVALDPLTGKRLVASTMPLPAHVQPSISRTLKGDFVASATPSDNNTQITWEFDGRSPRVLPPGTRSELPTSGGEAPRIAPIEVNSGTFKMDLKTGAVSSVESGQSRSEMFNPGEDLRGSQRLRSIGEGAFLSADGQDFLTSRQIGDNAELEKYLLSVFDTKTKTKIGEFKSRVSLVPFFVTDSRVIYESSPYAYRTGKELVEEPRRIRAVDLRTGREEWNFVLRDTTYQGSFPP